MSGELEQAAAELLAAGDVAKELFDVANHDRLHHLDSPTQVQQGTTAILGHLVRAGSVIASRFDPDMRALVEQRNRLRAAYTEFLSVLDEVCTTTIGLTGDLERAAQEMLP